MSMERRAIASTGREIALQVVSAGHRRVAILAGEREQAAMSARTEGFLEGLRSAGQEV